MPEQTSADLVDAPVLPAADESLVDESLVEQGSLDGMCCVY